MPARLPLLLQVRACDVGWLLTFVETVAFGTQTFAPFSLSLTADISSAAGSSVGSGVVADLVLKSAMQAEGEVALMHLMYKIADARSLAGARVGLASGGGGSSAPSPPPLVLDLWSDVVSNSIAALADSSVKGKYSHRAGATIPGG